MATEKVVVIFRERNDANVCVISLSEYPTGKVPAVGDKFPLHAEKTFMTSNTVGGEQTPTKITYIDGLVTVVDVWIGNGDLLHPNNGCPFYSFNDDVEGYGIRIAWDDEKIPPGAKPISAEVVFGL
jgi:hypothetical protein